MMFGQWLNSHKIFKQLAKVLIRLRVCAGSSEALLVAHTTLLEISCCGSIIVSPPRGYPFPCFNEINWIVPLFPKNRKFVFLCSQFPNNVFNPLFPLIFGLITMFLWNKYHFPLFLKSPWRTSLVKTHVVHDFVRLKLNLPKYTYGYYSTN